MLTILGRTSSSNVQKVMWCCDELGVGYRQEDVGHGKRNRDPEYLAKNPNGLVPTIVDDGFTLWESNAIVAYIASKYGAGTLYPAGLGTRALAHQWMDWCNTIGIPARRGLHRTLNVPATDQRDPKAISAMRDAFAKAMRILDGQLGRTTCIAGDALTFGDIPTGVLTHQWYGFDVDHGNMPNLERYYENLKTRPAFRRHVMRLSG